MKRIISLLISISLIFGMFFVNISFAESAEAVYEYKTELEFLKQLEIISGEYTHDSGLKRKETAKIVINMLYPGMTFSAKNEEEISVFNDISVSDPYYAYIEFCKASGTINGYSDGTFMPDNEITELELITILTNALGYSVVANAAGGYPSGIYTVARQSGILDGITFDAYSKVTINKAAKYIYNSLFCSLATFDHISNDGISIEINVGKNVICEKHGIKEYDAVIWDNGITSLSGESCEDTEKVGIREISGTKIIYAYDNGFGSANYLGTRVRIFIKYNELTGRNEVVYFAPHKYQEEKKVISDDIINITNNYIEYENDPTSGKTAKINFGEMPPVVVINGIKKTQYTSADLKPADGIIIANDYNQDGKYDILSVYNFNLKNTNTVSARNIVVDFVNTENEYIYCKFNPLANISLDEDEYILKFVSDYGIKSPSDLKEFDVISIAEANEKIDGKTLITLVVSRNTIKGTLASVSGNSVYISEEEYKVSSSLTSVKASYANTLAINYDLTAYLDITGKIAYSVSAAQKTVKYGYIMSAGVTSGFNNTLKIKLYTYEDDVLELDVSEKALIDGNKYDTPQKQYDAIIKRPDGPSKLTNLDTSIRRPVIYEINSEGLISRLDTDTPNYNTDSSSDNIYRTMTSIGYTNEEVDDKNALKAGFRNPHMYMVRMSNYSVEGKFFINSDTVLMKVPDIDTYGLNEFKKYSTTNGEFTQDFNYNMIKLHEGNIVDENYMILPVTNLSYLMSYDIQGYDIDPDTGVAGLAIIRGRDDWYDGGVSNDSRSFPLAVYLKTTDSYDNAREKMIKKLYYTIDGTENFVYFDPDEISFTQRYLLYGCDESYTPFNRAVEKLKAGDIIRVTKNGDWLSHLERVIKLDNIKNTQAVLSYPKASRYKYTTYESDFSYQQTKGMPFDVNGIHTSTGSNSVLGMMYVKQVKGNVLTGYIPTTMTRKYLSTIDLSDVSTYTEQMMDISTVTINILEKKPDGSYHLRKGDFSEIETVANAGGVQNADILIYKHSHYTAVELILVKQ